MTFQFSSALGNALKLTGVAVGASVATGVVTHGITKLVVRNSMCSVKTTVNLKALNERFVRILEEIPGDNKNARALCGQVLEDCRTLFIKEGGRPKKKGDFFNNANIDTHFITSFNQMIHQFDGRATQKILELLHLFKNDILSECLQYLIDKDFLLKDDDEASQNFSTVIRVNESRQMDLGISTIVLLLNTLLCLYENFFSQLSSQASLTRGADNQAQFEADLSGAFWEVLVCFLQSVQPLFQEGDSWVLSFCRSVLGIPSKRVGVLNILQEKVKEHHEQMVLTLAKHRADEKIASLMEALVCSGEIGLSNVSQLSHALLVKSYSDHLEGRVKISTKDSSHRLIDDFFIWRRDDFCSTDLALPAAIKVKRIGDMGKTGKVDFVSQEIANRQAAFLFRLSAIQTLSNVLASLLGSCLKDHGKNTVNTVYMSLLFSLLGMNNECMKETLTEILSGAYYDSWSLRHRRKMSDSKGVRPSGDDVFLKGIAGKPFEITVRDPRLLDLLHKVNKLPRSYAQKKLRGMIASLAHSSELLLALDTASNERREAYEVSVQEARPIYYKNLNMDSRNVMDFVAFLLSAEGGVDLSRALKKHWEVIAKQGSMQRQDSQGVSPVGLFQERLQERKRILGGIQEVLGQANKEIRSKELTSSQIKVIEKAFVGRSTMLYTAISFSTKRKKKGIDITISRRKVRTFSQYNAIKKEVMALLDFMSDIMCKPKKGRGETAFFIQLKALSHLVEVIPLTPLPEGEQENQFEEIPRGRSLSIQSTATDTSVDYSSRPVSRTNSSTNLEGGASRSRSPSRSRSASRGRDSASRSRSASRGRSSASSSAASVSSRRAVTVVSYDGNPFGPPADGEIELSQVQHSSRAPVELKEMNAGSGGGATKTSKALVPANPPPALQTRLPIVRSELAYWWSTGWFGGGKRDKRRDVFYSLYQLRAVLQRMHHQPDEDLPDGTKHKEKLQELLLETLDRTGSHRVSRHVAQGERAPYIAKSGRIFVKSLMRPENAYYLNLLLALLERGVREVHAKKPVLNGLLLRISDEYRGDDIEGLVDRVDRLNPNKPSDQEDPVLTSKTRLNGLCRVLFTFRILQYLSSRIDTGQQRYNAEEVLGISDRFYTVRRDARHILARTPLGNMLEKEGRDAANGHIVIYSSGLELGGD